MLGGIHFENEPDFGDIAGGNCVLELFAFRSKIGNVSGPFIDEDASCADSVAQKLGQAGQGADHIGSGEMGMIDHLEGPRPGLRAG